MKSVGKARFPQLIAEGQRFFDGFRCFTRKAQNKGPMRLNAYLMAPGHRLNDLIPCNTLPDGFQNINISRLNAKTDRSASRLIH